MTSDSSPAAGHDFVADLLRDIEASPTPYHAATTAAERLAAAGFSQHDRKSRFPTAAGGYYILDGGLMTAWVQPDRSEFSSHDGFCVVGAHTDSPNLRVKASPDYESAGWAQLAVSVYGGALTNSWLDRDLGLAGRVAIDGEQETEMLLFRDDTPLLRVPQLAIHLDREIRESGLLLNPQEHLDPLWSTGQESFVEYLAEQCGVTPDRILAWDVMAHDTLAPALVGRHGDLIASARIDNLFSSFCGVYALLDAAKGTDQLRRMPVLVLYDHEEVGSRSSTGADGASLSNTLERLSLALGFDRAGHLEGLANSFVVSADGAHATHPNYPDKHEPRHFIEVNKGIVIKQNPNQRYATDAQSDAWLRSICAENDVPVQTYIHRNDLPCGSTIGPISAARLGIPTVDCGAAQLAMHSIREMAGAKDVGFLTTALRGAYFS